MTQSLTVRDLGQVQSAADRLVNAELEVKESALEELSQTILGLFDEASGSTATNKLLSRELSLPIQNFAAIWFVRCLTRSSSALKFGDTETANCGPLRPGLSKQRFTDESISDDVHKRSKNCGHWRVISIRC